MLKKRSNLRFLILSSILVLGFLLRIYKINQFPPSLNWDEVSHGYNAFSILTSGRDEWGVKFPTIFRAYGDYKLPVYIYTTAISVSFFGLNEISVRLPSVISGTLMILLTYLITSRIFEIKKNKDFVLLPFVASFLVAVEPWSIFLSRPALEANMALALFCTGFCFLLKSNQKASYLTASLLFMGLSVWTYNSYRIFAPLMVFGYLVINRGMAKEVWKNKFTFVASLIVFLGLFATMFLQLLDTEGTARFSKVSIIDDGAVSKIIELRNRSPLPQFIERLLFNKPNYFAVNFIKNYLSHFSPEFLYIKGGSNYQFNIPETGLLHVIGSPFFILGLFSLVHKSLIFRSSEKRVNWKYRLLLLWLILAPIPASLTRESPHTLRVITILPIPMIITAYGIILFSKWFTEKYKSYNTSSPSVSMGTSRKFQVGIVLLLIFTLSTFAWVGKYIKNYSKEYSWSWQYGYKDAVRFAETNYEKYDKIIFTKKYGEPHEFVLFYTSWPVKKYLTDPKLERYEQSGWYWVDSFDKFLFVNEWDIPTEEWQSFVTERGIYVACQEIRCLLFTDADSIPKTWSKIHTIQSPDGKSIFEVVENKNE